MKRNKSINKIREFFDKLIVQIENTNDSRFSMTASSEKDGVKLFSINVELQ